MNEQPRSVIEADVVAGPPADRSRPRTLADVVGRGHPLAAGAPVGRMAGADRLVSTIL